MADSDSRSGSRYQTAQVQQYVDGLHARHDVALQRAFDAPDAQGMPAIQLGQAEARLVELLLRLVQAKKVVEVGTLAGYSAIRLARGMAPGGHVWSIELEPKHAAVARQNIAAAGLSDIVTVLEGPATQMLPTLERHGPFDAVFIDADKERYDVYGRWAAAHLRPGGLLLGDNAYFFGRLMSDEPGAVAMRRFHEEAARTFDTACVPTPDGLLLGYKRS